MRDRTRNKNKDQKSKAGNLETWAHFTSAIYYHDKAFVFVLELRPTVQGKQNQALKFSNFQNDLLWS